MNLEETVDQEDLLRVQRASVLQNTLIQKGIRVFPQQRVSGEFGFEIYRLNPDKDKIAGKPFIRETGYFTFSYKTYGEALANGVLEGIKLIV